MKVTISDFEEMFESEVPEDEETRLEKDRIRATCGFHWLSDVIVEKCDFDCAGVYAIMLGGRCHDPSLDEPIFPEEPVVITNVKKFAKSCFLTEKKVIRCIKRLQEAEFIERIPEPEGAIAAYKVNPVHGKYLKAI